MFISPEIPSRGWFSPGFKLESIYGAFRFLGDFIGVFDLRPPTVPLFAFPVCADASVSITGIISFGSISPESMGAFAFKGA